MNWRKYFATWLAVKDLSVAGKSLTANAVRVVRIHKMFFYFHYDHLVGVDSENKVRWMEKGSWIKPGGALHKILCKEYREFIESGCKDFVEFRSERASQQLLASLEK